jgi:hypothetical protein
VQQKTKKVREIVRIDVSEKLESRAVRSGAFKQRVFSVRASKFGQWLLLILALACFLFGASRLAVFNAILQKMMP